MEPINKDDITVTKSYKEFPDDDPGIEYYIRLWSETARIVEIREAIPEFADIDTIESHTSGDLAWDVEGRELVFRHRIDTDGIKTAYTYTDGLKNNLSEWMGEPEIDVVDGDEEAAAEESPDAVPLDEAPVAADEAAPGDADEQPADASDEAAADADGSIETEIRATAERTSNLTNREIADKVDTRVTLVRDVLSDEAYGSDADERDDGDETTALPAGVNASGLTDTAQAILETAGENPDLTNADIAEETGTTVATVRDTRVTYEPDKSADYGGPERSEEAADEPSDDESTEASSVEVSREWSPGEPSRVQEEILETALRNEALSNAEVADEVGARLPLVRDTLDDYDDWTLADLDLGTTYTREEPSDASDLTETQQAILRADAEESGRTNAEIAEAVGARIPVVRDTREKYAGTIEPPKGGDEGDADETADEAAEADASEQADTEAATATDDGEQTDTAEPSLGSTTEVDSAEISEAAEQLSTLEAKLTDTTSMTDDTADTQTTDDESAQTDDVAGDDEAAPEEAAPPAPETDDEPETDDAAEPELVEADPDSDIGQELLNSINGIKETIDDARVGGGQYEARIRRLETEISKLQSYTTALEEFLSDNGTGSQIIEAAREDIDEMQAAIKTLKNKRQTHETTLAELQNSVEGLEDDLWNNSKTIDKIESTLDTQRSGIDAIQDRVDALDEEIGNVRSTLDTRVSGHDDEIAELTDTTETHEQEIDTLEATTAAHTDELDSLTDTTSTHGEEIGDLTETTDVHGEEIDEVSETASRNEADIVDISEEVGSVADSLDDLSDEVDDRFASADADRGSLAEQIDDHANQLEALSSDIESISDSVATLEDRLADDGDVGGRIDDLEGELNELAEWRERLTSTLMTGGGVDSEE